MSYQENHREQMRRAMEERENHWHRLNIRQRRRTDRLIAWVSFVLGFLAIVCLSGALGHALFVRFFQ